MKKDTKMNKLKPITYKGFRIVFWQYRLQGRNVVYGQYRRVNGKHESRTGQTKEDVVRMLKKNIDQYSRFEEKR